MTTTTYKGYTIIRVGISYRIFRPESDPTNLGGFDGLESGLVASKAWINNEIKLKTLPRW